jgi:hypothetical protein
VSNGNVVGVCRYVALKRAYHQNCGLGITSRSSRSTSLRLGEVLCRRARITSYPLPGSAQTCSRQTVTWTIRRNSSIPPQRLHSVRIAGRNSCDDCPI